MTRQQLLDLHKATCEKAFSIFEAKNIDYASGDDPLANFKATEILGIPAELGVLTRCLDKFQRIKSFVDNGTLAVKSESVNDAIEDVINYMVLLKGVIEDRRTATLRLTSAEEAARHMENWVKRVNVDIPEDVTMHPPLPSAIDLNKQWLHREHKKVLDGTDVTIHPPLPSASEQSEETLLTPCAHANTTSVCIPVYEEIITFTCDDCDMVMIDSVWLHREHKKVLDGTDVTYPAPRLKPMTEGEIYCTREYGNGCDCKDCEADRRPAGPYSPKVGDTVIVNDETREISDVEGQVAEVILDPQGSQYAIRVAVDPLGTNIYADLEHLTKKEVTG